MIQHYELLALFPGTKTEEEIKVSVEQVHGVLQQHGAAITKQDFWEKRKLAYEIDHIRQGYYDLVEFDIESTKLTELDKVLRLNEHLLRHQIVRKELKSPEQLAAEQALRDRIAAKRQALREKETAAAIAEEAKAPVAVDAQPAGPVETQKLDEKLEEFLESDRVDV